MLRAIWNALREAWRFERAAAAMRKVADRVQPFGPRLRPGFRMPVEVPEPPERSPLN